MAKPRPADGGPTLPVPTEPSLSARRKPLVFVSHDSRDAALAEAFGNLLGDASGGMLKSFRSSDRKGTTGIEFGEEWYKAIMSRLGDATDVVALLTQNSLDRPWILYEAGVAKGKLDTTVFGVALGIPLEKISTGPFAQFQNCGDDEDSLTKLVLQLIRRNPEADPREEAVRRQVKAFGEGIGKLVVAPKAGAPSAAKVEEPAVAKLFEEVKVMFRDLPEKLEEKLSTSLRHAGGRRLRKVHPMLLEEMLHHPAFSESAEGEADFWLFASALFRDEQPLIGEIASEMHRSIRAGHPDAVHAARRRCMRLLELLHRLPIVPEEFGADRRILHTIERNLMRRLPPETKHPKRSKVPGSPDAGSDLGET